MKVLSWLLRTASAIDDRSEGNRLTMAAVLLSELLQVGPSDAPGPIVGAAAYPGDPPLRSRHQNGRA